MRRLLATALTVALALAGLGAPTLAGGWAVTTFDDLPGEFVAGTTYSLGYTIRQHGVTPVDVERTEVVATGDAAKTLSFVGSREGATGHYTARITFPAEGRYTWHVTQAPFAPQELGTIVVVARATGNSSAAGAAPASLPAAGSTDPVRTALPFVALAAAALFAWRLVTTLRGVRRPRVA